MVTLNYPGKSILNLRSRRQIQFEYHLYLRSCPNMGECWGEGTATFMILEIFVHVRGFFSVKTGRPETVDWEEPEKVAQSIKIMKIKHAASILLIGMI